MTHENVIEMREITKIFGQFVANDKINLHLRRGEIHALLGENGAGKSTLMNMLAGLLEPTSGEIAVNGQVVKLFAKRVLYLFVYIFKIKFYKSINRCLQIL